LVEGNTNYLLNKFFGSFRKPVTEFTRIIHIVIHKGQITRAGKALKQAKIQKENVQSEIQI